MLIPIAPFLDSSFLLVGKRLEPVAIVQRSPQASEVEARKFVQGFYDWYTKVALESTQRSWDVAIRVRASTFTPELLKWLKVEARDGTRDGFIEGFDVDMFCYSQDPWPRYVAREVKYRAGSLLVYVHGVDGKKVRSEWDVAAKVSKASGQWRIQNLLYPGDVNLLDSLATFRAERAKRDRRKQGGGV